MNEDELDRRLDDELRAAFAPPPAPEFAALAERIARPRGGVVRRWPWALLAVAAAAVVLIGFVVAGPWGRSNGSAGSDEVLGRAWVAAYESAEKQGFGGSCCSPGFDMGAVCQDRFACCLGVGTGGSLAVVGGYAGDAPPDCLALLARDGEMPMCVFVMHKAKDRRVSLPHDSDLHLARRELGDLVLYAIADAPPDGALAQFVLP